jgi:D-alanyl-D-alanine carboxypeptidase
MAGFSSDKTAAAPAAETSARLSEVGEERKPGVSTREQPSSPPPSDTCDDLTVLVDREHQLPPDYAPRDLVSVEAYGVPVYGDEMLLRREAAEQLGRMTRAANAAGEEILVSSAYRSFAQQGTAFARLVSIYGVERARWTSAPPGQSQHQLGTAVDFTNSYVGYEIHKSFGRTTASTWLMEHAPEYGFVLSYPNHKETKTGYRWEPWHYRYIGTENARRMRESGATLQEFLAREGVEPRC